jgi:DNA modification methylase
MHDEEHVKKNKEKQAEKVAKAETLGRFPANLIHDGSDEVTELFPKDRKAGGNVNPQKRKPANVYGNYESAPEYNSYGDEGSAARFFYCAKTSKKDRNEGLDDFEEKNNHPTVKPTDLMRYLVTMVTPKGGTTLDPFMGSGSTGRGAKLGGFNFIGIELDPDYLDIAKARIDAIVEESTLDEFFV